MNTIEFVIKYLWKIASGIPTMVWIAIAAAITIIIVKFILFKKH